MSSDARLHPKWRHFHAIGELRASDLLIVLALLGVTSSLALIFAGQLGETRLTMIYLAPVLACAVYLGVWPGFCAALGAVGLLNFLFAVPRYSLFVADMQDLLTLLMFFMVAATTGVLAGNLREQRDAARANARALHILSTTSGLLHAAETRERVLEITRDALAELAKRPVVILSRQGQTDLSTATPVAQTPLLQPADLLAAELALSRGRSEPATAPGWNGSGYTFLPIRLGDSSAGQDDLVLGIARQAPGQRLDPYEDAATEVLCQHCELALHRLKLGDRVVAERERASMAGLRAALLSSLSHDLRSPLAGILGSVTTLKDLGPALPPEAQHDLLQGIEAETRRLTAYVTNLLQLTRLHSLADAHFQPVSLREAVEAGEDRLRQTWPSAEIAHDFGDLPLIHADQALLEQALYNLLDNAMRHGGGKISLRAAREGEMLRLTIADQGPRPGAQAAASALSGAGLGLMITRAIATALGGQLDSTPHLGGRAVTLSLPLRDKSAVAPTEAGAP